MRILAIGDIFGRAGREAVFEGLERHRNEYDFVIANAENASHGNGISKSAFNELTSAGVEAFTLGNHTWGCPDVEALLRYNDNIVRPANYEGEPVGSGSTIVKAKNGVKIGIVNLIGRTYMMQNAFSPFTSADAEIEKLKEKTNIILVDFHAEATSEKIAMGYYLDGKVSAVFGTHTHVQTADLKILQNGTGYITDLGMTGPAVSVLGVDRQIIIKKFLSPMPQKFVVATGKSQFNAVIFDIDEKTGKTIGINRIYEEY